MRPVPAVGENSDYRTTLKQRLGLLFVILKQRDTPLFLKIGSFYNSLRVKQLSFTIFESNQPIF